MDTNKLLGLLLIAVGIIDVVFALRNSRASAPVRALFLVAATIFTLAGVGFLLGQLQLPR